MKLLNKLVIAGFGMALAACSSTSSSTSDGGTDGAVVDTGTTPVDTGVKTDTGTGGDAGADTSDPCSPCLSAKCSAESTKCVGEASCKAGLDCIGLCTTSDCINKCVSDSKNPDGTAGNNKLNDFLTCAIDNCKAACGL